MFIRFSDLLPIKTVARSWKEVQFGNRAAQARIGRLIATWHNKHRSASTIIDIEIVKRF